MFSSNDILQFYDLFTPNMAGYGLTQTGELVNGKVQANCTAIAGLPTQALIAKHLEGQIGIGLAPIRADSTCYWGAIDIDEYLGNLMDIVDAIRDFNLPLAPCYSKSKKLHIYIFFSKPTPAPEVIELLRWYAALFRCSDKVEVFPKQSKIASDQKLPSWINLPYYAANSDNHRKLVIEKDKLLPLPDFVTYAQERRLTIKEHWDKIHELAYNDAPMCILSGVLLRDIPPGQRNQWLYNVACYLRMKDESADIEEPLLTINATLHTPLAEKEIRHTVARATRETYYYQCSGMIGCNKKLCSKQEQGIGNNTATTGFSFGQLTQVLSDPPYWTWEVNGKLMTFYSTDDLLSQSSFRRQCMDLLHQIPYKVKDERWTKIMNRALENVQEQQVNVQGGFGVGSRFMDALTMYIYNGKQRAKNEADATITGRVWVNPLTGEAGFTSNSFVDFLRERRGIRDIGDQEIQARITALGGHQEGSLWYVPTKAVTEPLKMETQIDYTDTEQETDYDVHF